MIKSQTFFQARHLQGIMNEDFYKPIIEKDIKQELNCNSKYSLFDFENDGYKVELKCREVERKKYATTIVGYDKIEKGLEYIQQNKRVIFYFGFKNDGLFKYELTLQNYKDFKVSYIGCRFRENKKKHLEIPVDALKFVSDVSPIQDEYSRRVNL